MYGRGVAVSKSDFATYAFALRALKAAVASTGAKLGGSVELHFTYDEEVGGATGPARLLEQKISRPDYAISAGFAYGITIAHNGCLHLEVEIVGKSAHAARPDTGVDALEAATAVLAALYAIRKTYAATKSRTDGIDSPTLTVGLISGGINTNVVPDKVTLRLDRRIIPEENAAEVEATLTRRIDEAAARWPGIACHVRRILLALPFVPIPGQERLVAAIARHATRIMGEEVKAHGVPIYTDARLYSTRGDPDGALRRRSPYAARGQRPSRRREAEARRPVQGDRGDRRRARRSAGCAGLTGAAGGARRRHAGTAGGPVPAVAGSVVASSSIPSAASPARAGRVASACRRRVLSRGPAGASRVAGPVSAARRRGPHDTASATMNGNERGILRDMFDAAINAAQPAHCVPRHLPAAPKGRTIVIGAGKASAAMAQSRRGQLAGRAVRASWSRVTATRCPARASRSSRRRIRCPTRRGRRRHSASASSCAG